jgi:hypothetical protein
MIVAGASTRRSAVVPSGHRPNQQRYPKAMSKRQRIYYADTMRSILMLLGVVAHSSYIYITGASWLIHDAQASPLFDTIGTFQFIFACRPFYRIGFLPHDLTRYGALPEYSLRRLAFR